MVWQGPAIVADGSTELRKRLPAALFGEWFGPGSSRRGLVVHGRVWLGLHWSGNRCRRQHWGACSPLLLSTESGLGWIRHGATGRGVERSGLTRPGKAADGSTGASEPLCCSRKGVVKAWRGRARSGSARRAEERPGNSCRRQHGGLMLSLLLSTGSSHGVARWGRIGLGRVLVRQGRVRRGWVGLGKGGESACALPSA